MYYSAEWQLLEEHIDDSFNDQTGFNDDRRMQYVWGLRYIDDIVLRQQNFIVQTVGNQDAIWYHCMDTLFSTVAALLIAFATGDWSLVPMMWHFMAGFFLVFSFFKLIDLSGFVTAYRGYDLLAARSASWAYAYPFVELALGIAYLIDFIPVLKNIVTFLIMTIGAIGVLKALLDKRRIQCACLGTALDLPMTKVTLIEDLTMAAMAAGMLIMLWM